MNKIQFRENCINHSSPAFLPHLASRFQKELLDKVDVKLNGNRHWDISIRDDRVFSRVIRDGSLGFAESYMQNWWECMRLDELFTRLLKKPIDHYSIGLARVKLWFGSLAHFLFNFQSISRSYEVGTVHYDIGNELYQKMLGPSLMYSCGYWQGVDSLDQAQHQKLDLICRKLKLEPGMKLLDIGCGWGTFAQYAAEHYGAIVTGITISNEQYKLATTKTKPYDVNIRLMDYRQLQGTYDRIVSIGMFEHVGIKNYQTFFKVVGKLLAPDGIFLLHTIGQEISTNSNEGFLGKYIFPNSHIPSRRQINKASVDLLRLEDWHNFGSDYDKTLMAWADNFEKHWSELKDKYNTTFYRMWRYYLYSCAGYFRSRQGQLWQLVFTPLQSTQSYSRIS